MSRTLRSAFLIGFSLVQPVVAIAQSPEPNEEAERLRFFDAEVLPILRERCYACHSHAQDMQGGLVLDFASGWQQGGSAELPSYLGSPM